MMTSIPKTFSLQVGYLLRSQDIVLVASMAKLSFLCLDVLKWQLQPAQRSPGAISPCFLVARGWCVVSRQQTWWNHPRTWHHQHKHWSLFNAIYKHENHGETATSIFASRVISVHKICPLKFLVSLCPAMLCSMISLQCNGNIGITRQNCYSQSQHSAF